MHKLMNTRNRSSAILRPYSVSNYHDLALSTNNNIAENLASLKPVGEPIVLVRDNDPELYDFLMQSVDDE